MTASTTFARAVRAAIHGHSERSTLNFLRNFNKSRDAAAVPSAASVSTKKFVDTRTLAGNANESLDLSGSLPADDGTVMTLTKVHAIYVKADSANNGSIQIGGAAANGFQGPFVDITDKVFVSAGEEFLATSTAGWLVTAGTGDLLKIANTGGAAGTYDIVIIGE